MLRLLALAALACHGLACSSDGQGARDAAARANEPDDDTLIVPQGLTVLALEGGNGVLGLFALTLRQGKHGVAVYAALRNDGDIPACHAILSLELYDKDRQSLAVGTGGLLTEHFYRLDDGSDTVAACVAPGDVSMAAITDWPTEVTLDSVGYAVYRCPYFALSVVPIAGLSVDDVKRVTSDSGATYSGTVVNGLDVSVKDPSIAVFPVNHGGRPLGVVTSGATLQIPAGGSWAFQTSPLDTLGVDQIAYPEASIAN